jgi:putative MATE family efflux protein
MSTFIARRTERLTPAPFPDAARRRQILALALPIIGAMVSQTVLNIVDTAMVGRLGDVALAAAGIGSFAAFMAVSLVLGISTGVQAIASRRLGEGRGGETGQALNGGLLLALCGGLPLLLLFHTQAETVLTVLNDDPAVREEGARYFAARALGIVAVGMNFAFRGYWNAMHMTAFYMATLLFMHSVNVFLNWVLIFGNLGAPALGVEGAGLATTLSLYLGTITYTVLAFVHARESGFMRSVPSARTLLTMARVSLPASMQQLFFSSGMVTLFWIIGQVGTAEVAAANVLTTLVLAALLPSMGFGLAAATLVGNALGRGEPEDAYRWGWQVAYLAMLAALLITLPVWIVPELLLGVFITDPQTLELALWPLRITAATIWFDAMGMVLMQAQLGAGASRRTMTVTLVAQWLLFLPVAYLAGPVLGGGLLLVWLCNGLYRLGQASWFMRDWRQRNWASIQV